MAHPDDKHEGPMLPFLLAVRDMVDAYSCAAGRATLYDILLPGLFSKQTAGVVAADYTAAELR